jgi:regulator of RNase E activity RraA
MQLTGARRNPSGAALDPKIVDALRAIPVALLSDALHRSTGSIGIRPYHSPAPMVGRALTVRTRGGDNFGVLRAFDQCRAGDVLVVDAGGNEHNAIVGGIMTFYMASIGMAGFVVDGAIRDVAEIAARTFPVYARAVNHRGPYKDGPAEINVPVSVGGMVVNPGDIVVGDQDGLLAFAPAEAGIVIEKALAQQRNEEQTMQAIREGRWDLSFVDALEKRIVN